MRSQSLLGWIILGLMLCVSKAIANETLCRKHERVVFSCWLAPKTVSLCATPTLNATSGRLTYRFGLPGHKPDLIYPAQDKSPASAFTTYFQQWNKGRDREVTFKLREHTYTVYNRSAAFELDERSNGGGVRVSREGKIVTDTWCVDATIEDNIWDLLHEIGLPETK